MVNVKLSSKYVFTHGLVLLRQQAAANAETHNWSECEEVTGQVTVECSARNGTIRFIQGWGSTAEEGVQKEVSERVSGDKFT